MAQEHTRNSEVGKRREGEGGRYEGDLGGEKRVKGEGNHDNHLLSKNGTEDLRFLILKLI